MDDRGPPERPNPAEPAGSGLCSGDAAPAARDRDGVFSEGGSAVSRVGGVRVEIRYTKMHLERPPKMRLFFDLRLENGAAAARWVLLSDQLPRDAGTGHRVHALEVYLLGAGPRAVVGHMIGEQGAQALLLPAGAGVRLRRFPILYWGDKIPEQVTVEAIGAAQVAIGDAAATAWFGADPARRTHGVAYPASDPGADVDASALAEQMDVYASTRSADDRDVPVHLSEADRVELWIEIPS